MIHSEVEVHEVEHLDSWRANGPYRLSFLLPDRDVDGESMASLLQKADESGLLNPRVINPSVIFWSSLLHPRFYKALQGSGSKHAAKQASLSIRGLGRLTQQQCSEIHLESMLFLAGVTLSAAVIQGRWSEGTIGSKLDRLWHAGQLSAQGICATLKVLDLCTTVGQIARGSFGIDSLIEVRRQFMRINQLLASGKPCLARQVVAVDPVPPKFKFVDELVTAVPSVKCIVVYGSSVSGDLYKDYDVVVIVSDAEAALRRLANTRPTWNGVEINMSIYSPSEFWCMQTLSGDNLADYGLCVFGEIQCPEKPIEPLLMRNMSFAMVRHRQQLGMASIASKLASPTLDSNLQDYFVKIPANVIKGTIGATGRRLSKEEAHAWLREKVCFDTALEQKRALTSPQLALCNSACATAQALDALNHCLNMVEISR